MGATPEIAVLDGLITQRIDAILSQRISTCAIRWDERVTVFPASLSSPRISFTMRITTSESRRTVERICFERDALPPGFGHQ